MTTYLKNNEFRVGNIDERNRNGDNGEELMYSQHANDMNPDPDFS